MKKFDTLIEKGDICLILNLPGSAIAVSGLYISIKIPRQSYFLKAVAKFIPDLIQFPIACFACLFRVYNET